MDARTVIQRPILTEQSVMGMDEKKYTFIVDPRANKSHVKHAIQELFDVEVKKVNILNTARKPKRLGQHAGYRKSRKKAIVTLTEASNDIDLFGNAEDEE